MTVAGPRVAILNYRMGNLRSVQKALELAGSEAVIATEPSGAAGADALVLPGVGAFGDAMDNLRRLGFDRMVLDAVDRGTPLLGICVGLQVLFETSTEMGEHNGLGLFQGRVVRFPAGMIVPHVGWNQLHLRRQHHLTEGMPTGAHSYFTHSYYAEPSDASLVVATSEYGVDFASICARESVYGVQFHPEKSWDVGRRLLRAFVASLA